jgi:hypothetical protein
MFQGKVKTERLTKGALSLTKLNVSVIGGVKFELGWI